MYTLEGNINETFPFSFFCKNTEIANHEDWNIQKHCLLMACLGVKSVMKLGCLTSDTFMSKTPLQLSLSVRLNLRCKNNASNSKPTSGNFTKFYKEQFKRSI